MKSSGDWSGRLPVAVYAIALLHFLARCAPDVTWMDSGELIAGAFTGGVLHGSGYALYVWIAKLFSLIPVGNVAVRIVALNVVCGAALLSLLFFLATRGLQPKSNHEVLSPWVRSAVTLLVLFFATRPVTLSEAGIAENSMLFHLLVLSTSAVLFLAYDEPPGPGRRRRLLSSLALLALTGSYVPLAWLGLPFVVLALRRDEPRALFWGSILASIMVSAAPLLGIAIRAAQSPAVNMIPPSAYTGWLGAVEGYAKVYVPIQTAPTVFTNVAAMANFNTLEYVGQFFPGPLAWPVLGLAAVGVVAFWRKRRLPVVFMLTTGLAAAVVRMFNKGSEQEGHSFVLPMMIVLWACWGLVRISEWRWMWPPPPRWLGGVTAAVKGTVVAASVAVAFQLVHSPLDLRSHRSAREYADAVWSDVSPNAILLARSGRTHFLLWPMQLVENRRPDVALESEAAWLLNLVRQPRSSSTGRQVSSVQENLGEKLSHWQPDRPLFVTEIGRHSNAPGKLGVWSSLKPGHEARQITPQGAVFYVDRGGTSPSNLSVVRKPSLQVKSDRWAVEHWKGFYLDVALLSKEEDRPDRQEAYLREALALDPADKRLRLALGWFLEEGGRWEEARAVRKGR